MTSPLIYQDNPQTREEAADVIRMGGVIAFRTDTFYGLGADPLNPDAVRKVRELKGREDDKPILVLISDESELDRFTIEPSEASGANEASGAFQKAVRLYWPGPLTLVTRARAGLPEELTAGTETIGLRLPADERVRKLVRACGRALTATSANTSGHPPAFSAEEVQSYFSEGLDMIIDGGYAISPEPSTVVDVTSSRPRVIRRGVISDSELAPILSLWR
jgi:L-threonylcarbamoyladenylate synthase